MRRITKKKCEICQKVFGISDLFPIDVIGGYYIPYIEKMSPHFDPKGFICSDDHLKVRTDYIKDYIEKDIGEITEVENEVIESIKTHDILAENINEDYDEHLTFGQKLADHISSFGGSWRFILIFLSFMIIWMTYNTYILSTNVPDPYPYILLNLILSCLAAIQAPVIMMSQNRREVKYRLQAESDYKVNLKAELQIRHLHHKMDRFMKYQWLKNDEFQELMIESHEELSDQLDEMMIKQFYKKSKTKAVKTKGIVKAKD